MIDLRTSAPRILQQTGAEWAEVDIGVTAVCPIAAFSQGEILEYSREPVGRMALIDSSVDLEPVGKLIANTIGSLRANARQLIAARNRARQLAVEAAKEGAISTHEASGRFADSSSYGLAGVSDWRVPRGKR